MDRFKDAKESEDQLKLTGAQMQAAEENLEFLGMGPTQLKEVARTRKIARNIELRSPVAGVVLVRNAFPGLRFERGTELFRVADLSHVWILADVFENEAQHFRPGTVARLILPRSRAMYEAKVTGSVPQFGPSSRTLKVRLETDNPGFALRLDTFVDVELPVKLPPGLSIPADAVIDSGLHKRVYVDRGNGFFEPREIEIGWREGDRVQVVKGLMPGERIVVSGTFLVDSESRMKAAAIGIYGSTIKDPVCGMDIDESGANASGRKTDYSGKTYYFCSDLCKGKFDKNPEQYRGREPEAGGQRSGGSSHPKMAKDPVCGMEVDTTDPGTIKTEYRGKTYYFCATTCRDSFLKEPTHYAGRD